MMGCLLTKRQQPLNVFQFDRHGQFSKHSTQVSIRFNLICLSRLNQTIQIRAGLSTLNTIREQPVLSADHNVNRTFSNRFIQRTKPLPSQLTILTQGTGAVAEHKQAGIERVKLHLTFDNSNQSINGLRISTR